MDRGAAAGNYRAVAEGALGWVTSTLDLFELPPLEDADLITKLKPFGELVLSLDVVCERSPDAPRVEAVFEWAWEQTAQGHLFEQVVLENHELLSLSWIYEIFQRRGYERPSFTRLLESLLEMRSVRSLEMLAWRELELATSLLDLGIGSPWSREESLRRTWLAAPPEPWEMSVTFGYSLTHTVFYATRFGRSPDDLPASMRDHLAEWWPVWTRFFLRDDNLDLVGEMVMTARCAGLEDEERLDQILLDAQQSDGLIPGPTPPGAPPAVDGSREKRFATNYHTTLVGLMAGAMSSGT